MGSHRLLLLLSTLAVGVRGQSSSCPTYTDKGMACVFPFAYKGVEYFTCTSANHYRPWCSLTRNYGRHKYWGNCIVKTTDGGICKFPFTHNGVTYRECTTMMAPSGDLQEGRHWCSYVTSLQPGSDMWGECATDETSGCAPEPQAPACLEFTNGGNGMRGPCMWPFLYNDVKYASCIIAKSKGDKSWCSVTDSFPRNKVWGYCDPPELVVYTFGGTPCVFPFEYAGRMFYGCTADFSSSGTAWCATKAYLAEGENDWDYCNLQSLCGANTTELTCQVPTSGGNADGAPCAFPFIYKGSIYDQCTSDHSEGLDWCATTSNYDEDRTWGICEDIVCRSAHQGPANCKSLTYAGNAKGAHCRFPFVYEGVVYQRCTTVKNNGVPWCAITSNYDRQRRWGNCADPSCIPTEVAEDPVPSCREFTQGGNARGEQCVFPFTYRGRQHYSCTTIKNEGRRWCATVSNYDVDKRWGNCIGCDLDMPKCPVRTRGGNDPGSLCEFPFIYKKKAYSNCAIVKHDRPWCATVRHYDSNKRWANCIIETTDGRECVFPFTYNQVKYKRCTKAVKGDYWCATTTHLRSFDSGLWGFCNMNPEPPCSTIPTIEVSVTPTLSDQTPTLPDVTETVPRAESTPSIGTPVNPETTVTLPPVPSTVPVTMLSLTTPTFECLDAFETVSNMHSFGGSVVMTATTEAACKNWCRGDDDCEAVDFNISPSTPANQRCFWHTAGYLASMFPTEMITQYRRIRTCPR